jgi:N-acetylglucosamine-6-phosphate deacetylase
MGEMKLDQSEIKRPHCKSLLLQNASVVVIDEILANTNVVINSGRVCSVTPATQQVQVGVEETVDLHGLRVFPGFIDLHMHGAIGVDTMTAGKDDLRRVSLFLATQGVTAWLPTLVPATASEYQRAVGSIETLMTEQSEEQVCQGARVLGVHYEGPFVNASQCGALHANHFKSFASVANLDALPTPNVADAVRMMTLAPEVDGAIELTRELVSRGWIVSLGHTRAGIEHLEAAFAAGARHMTHFMNAMPSLHHRAPGPVGWGLVNEGVSFDLIADGVHLEPLMLKLLLRAKGPELIMLISDAIAAAGAGDGDYQIWGETISAKNGRTSNARGNIAGSVITMLDAVRMMQSLGVSEVEIAKMAAGNPARLLRVEQERGTIATGKSADLVGLDAEGNVGFVMVAGSIVQLTQMPDVGC